MHSLSVIRGYVRRQTIKIVIDSNIAGGYEPHCRQGQCSNDSLCEASQNCITDIPNNRSLKPHFWGFFAFLGCSENRYSLTTLVIPYGNEFWKVEGTGSHEPVPDTHKIPVQFYGE